MFQLTSRHRFAVFFTLYLFIFILILYSLFFAIFNFMVDYQIKKSLSEHMNEIINNRLVIDNNIITFKKDSDGSSLREFLVNEDLAAIFFDSKNNLVRSYGIFTVDNNQSMGKNIIPNVKQVITSKKLLQTKISWNSLQLNTFIVPLINDGRISGVMVLAKSISDYIIMRQTMITVFSVLGMATLLGSFFVGYILSFKTFLPIRKLTNTIEQLDFEQSEIHVHVKGNPKDELIILATKFNDMTDRLRDMTKRQKEFIANASHELKTPLTRAITSLELIESENKNLGEIKHIKDDLFHINTILEKLLLLTKMKKDIYISTRPQKILMLPMFERLRKLFAVILYEKHLQLLGTFPQTIEVVLPVEFLEIMFSNLISNSIKFSSPNKIIKLNVKEINKKLVIQVKDQGSGMNKDEIDQMFKRFYRGNQINKEAGHGIGLSLVKQICDLYGIKIDVVSVKKIGTTVTLTFS
ncbi:MAG: HAMP domain-containing sensor histidine kinase [Patescibacteria group bacterium]